MYCFISGFRTCFVFAYIVFAKDAPNFAAKERAKASPDEAAQVIRNSIAYYGKYKLDEKDGTMEWNIEHSTFQIERTDRSELEHAGH